MKKLLLQLCAVIFAMTTVAAQSNVTFQVDMSQYGGSTANGVFVNGTWNNWCGSCNPLTDANNDGVWEGTFSIPNGQIEYKFTVNGWTDQENFMPGMPCTLTTGPFTNRVATVSANATFPVVCWGSCAACAGISADSIDVTFEVNDANITPDPAGLFLAGGGTFGNPGDNPMTDANNDGIWTITVRLPKGFMTDYTFTNGNCPNWGCKENIAGQPCAVPPFSDRHFPGAWSDTTVSTCFGACTSDGTCPTPSTNINVTFLVNMNNQTVDPTGVFIGANFDNWSGGIAMTDSNNDGIWEHTATLLSNTSYEWKFINGANWATAEQFDSTQTACTITVGQFINRFVTTGSSDTTLPAFLFNSCDAAVGTEEVFTTPTLFELMPTLANDFAMVVFQDEAMNSEKTIRVMNAVGQVIFVENLSREPQYRLNTANWSNGMYFITLQVANKIQTARIVVQH